MPWFQVDDGLAFHPKALEAGNPALGLWVRAGSWSMQHLTEGRIPSDVARMLGTPAEAKSLVKAGLWSAEPDGFRFHQWNGRQRSKQQVERDREKARLRKQKERARDEPIKEPEW